MLGAGVIPSHREGSSIIVRTINAFGCRSRLTPKRERHAKEAIDGDGLECQQDDGDHEYHQLPGLCEYAKRDNQCRCPRWRVRRAKHDHQSSRQP